MGNDCYGKACTLGHAHIDEQKGPEVELGGQAQHAVDELGSCREMVKKILRGVCALTGTDQRRVSGHVFNIRVLPQ